MGAAAKGPGGEGVRQYQAGSGKVVKAVYDNGVKLPLYCCYMDRENLEAADIPSGYWGLCPTHIRIGRIMVELATMENVIYTVWQDDD